MMLKITGASRRANPDPNLKSFGGAPLKTSVNEGAESNHTRALYNLVRGFPTSTSAKSFATRCARPVINGSTMRDPLVAKCRSMTLNQIAQFDKGVLATHYEAAIMNSYEDLASGFFNRPHEELIAESRRNGRIRIQGCNWCLLHTDEIVNEYDYEMDLVSRIRHESSTALTESYVKYLSEHASEIASLDLKETLTAMLKYRASFARSCRWRLDRCLSMSESGPEPGSAERISMAEENKPWTAEEEATWDALIARLNRDHPGRIHGFDSSGQEAAAWDDMNESIERAFPGLLQK